MAISEPKSAHLREVLLFAFNWKKSATEAHRMLEEVYSDHPLSKSQCYRWFKKFQSGDFELDNEPHGKPPQKFEDAELQAFLDEDSTQMQEKLVKTAPGVSRCCFSTFKQPQNDPKAFQMGPPRVERKAAITASDSLNTDILSQNVIQKGHTWICESEKQFLSSKYFEGLNPLYQFIELKKLEDFTVSLPDPRSHNLKVVEKWVPTPWRLKTRVATIILSSSRAYRSFCCWLNPPPPRKPLDPFTWRFTFICHIPNGVLYDLNIFRLQLSNQIIGFCDPTSDTIWEGFLQTQGEVRVSSIVQSCVKEDPEPTRVNLDLKPTSSPNQDPDLITRRPRHPKEQGQA
ncbi:hypothetical protein LAZ67_16001829 [Cordylochernes scorpioides]|uniref:Mos1 transposase HTH domain-containing protein n=1 Tax=Cordylochernes scorpioides TaxID=51811 RepID=A0ABY6LE72_9ARAC|nr:hypothetical protein LAZ67_16001829 [Cordylochernes scorpioides]